jgi:hypothetical protein
MEPSQLQLILNVVGITAVSTFVAMCFLYRRENRRLAEGLNHQEDSGAIVAVPAAPMSQQDVRELAQNRRTEWVQGLSSAISFAKGFQK